MTETLYDKQIASAFFDQLKLHLLTDPQLEFLRDEATHLLADRKGPVSEKPEEED